MQLLVLSKMRLTIAICMKYQKTEMELITKPSVYVINGFIKSESYTHNLYELKRNSLLNYQYV